jgi:hypothetical protein
VSQDNYLALLDDATSRRLATPGHDFSITPTRMDREKATRYLIECSACDLGLTRTIRDRTERTALAAYPHSSPHRRSLALVELLRPLLDDFARLHMEHSTGL